MIVMETDIYANSYTILAFVQFWNKHKYVVFILKLSFSRYNTIAFC
jgi:hypothetical protein